jgi:hypothetical protein
MQPYIYKTLAQGEIRLLTLHPGAEGTRVRISLDNTPLLPAKDTILYAQFSLKELQKTLPTQWTVWETLGNKFSSTITRPYPPAGRTHARNLTRPYIKRSSRFLAYFLNLMHSLIHGALKTTVLKCVLSNKTTTRKTIWGQFGSAQTLMQHCVICVTLTDLGSSG